MFFYKKRIKDYGTNNTVKTFDNSTLPKNLSVIIKGNNNLVIIDKNINFKNSKIQINSNDNVIKISHSKSLVMFDVEIKFGDRQKLIIGENFSCAEGTKIWLLEPDCEVIIGNDCMCSTDVHFIASDGHCIVDKDSKKILNRSKGIKVGNHVWIGTHARLLKNSIVPDNSIVGCNAVITKDFSGTGGVVLAGNPAKVKKENVMWYRESIANRRQHETI